MTADGIRAHFAAIRAEALEARRLEWRAAVAAWLERGGGGAGACELCLSSGVDYQRGTACSCAHGAAYLEAEALKEARKRAQVVAYAYEHALARAGMPPEYDALTLDTYPRQHAPGMSDLRRFLEQWNGKRGLVLRGPYGTGKTALACALARAITRAECAADPAARFRVRFHVASALLRDLRAAMSPSAAPGSYDAILSEARTARLLILDDLGRTNPGEWASETLFDVINTRYNAALPLIVTTNYGEDKLIDRLGEHGGAIMDRIGERCVWLTLSGSSLRRRATL